MKNFNKLILLIITFSLFSFTILTGCKTTDVIIVEDPKWEGEYNVEVIFSEDAVSDVKRDTLGFYRLFIDKKQEERTSIGLRSQKRIWRGKISMDRHLIQLERWELSIDSKEYKRAKNLIQPKPSHVYFTVKKDRLTQIFINSSENGFRYNLDIKFSP